METIAHVSDPSLARVLIVALKAHGFHPDEGGQNGLPGMPGVLGPKGIPIQVPEEEARDAKLLADDLLKQMLAR
ncbi:MAG: hypothetical protein BGO82_07470 [Devosia sp. 67-54]|uniref:hypothetical protein n=1 Tax=unclassified Devosia TaxID=196773 RepID=UPI0009678FB3|nr:MULTISPECIES: hypothetical protein [unclassified Devosia]MBN9307155.1 hypothetical protein [Devosia sp.]OJX19557.1 MAG: hypothetical protein BGO82_07470 [Devosia sp. 67-54]